MDIAAPTAETLGGTAVAGGVLVVVREGVTLDDLFAETTPGAPSPVLGIDESHMLVYAHHDVTRVNPVTQKLGGPLAAGFHLMEVIPGGAPETPVEQSSDTLDAPADGSESPPEESDLERDALRPSPQDLSTPLSIELRDDFYAFDSPHVF